jgi:hypothetical protein
VLLLARNIQYFPSSLGLLQEPFLVLSMRLILATTGGKLTFARISQAKANVWFTRYGKVIFDIGEEKSRG